MNYRYQTKGTCSSRIDFELDENGVIGDVTFTGGCNGNLKGISRLVKGHPAEEIIGLLKGTRCGMKNTSCPDQLATALQKALDSQKNG
ncbi:MAG: TIGR03905 family TSCPD domain-containing protein [Bilifractor sp.]|jgi:uncharacterized protein (TIGR03905 family)